MTGDIVDSFKTRYVSRKGNEMSLMEYLELCKTDPSVYATAAERMLTAIGAPTEIDTSRDARLARIFQNKKIRTYAPFSDFYGMEDTIEEIVGFFRHASQGLEEKKQVLYLLGPVGGGKSSLAERLKELFEAVPFYTLKVGSQLSPLFESPLGLFDPKDDARLLGTRYNIDPRYIKGPMSPWAAKRLQDMDGDISQFSVVKVWPSRLNRVAIAKTEPGDENNQDISVLVGKVDIRKLEDYSQDDPDAYSYSGVLNVTAQGIAEIVEIFKANIKTLHPLLTSTQEGHYNGTESFGAMPFHGVILAHSNESEWEKFRNNRTNEAFIDRLSIVKVPYCLRVSEEELIYKKLIEHSTLHGAVCAPGTLEMLARFSILTRLKEPENSRLFSKLEIYDGKNLKDTDPQAKSIQEYRDDAGVSEGMDGISTRFAYKILSKVYNFDSQEVAANPVHLMYVLEKQIQEEQFKQDVEEKYKTFIKGILAPRYATFLEDEVQKAYLESYSEYGQNLFDRYIMYADAWIRNEDYRDPDTGEMYDREQLNSELEKIEKPAGITSAKEFRNEVWAFVLRARANNAGKNVSWTSYEKLRNVIEKKMFASTDELLPVISFNKKASAEEENKHKNFVERMMSKGYTERQVRLLVEWYMRFKKHS